LVHQSCAFDEAMGRVRGCNSSLDWNASKAHTARVNRAHTQRASRVVNATHTERGLRVVHATHAQRASRAVNATHTQRGQRTVNVTHTQRANRVMDATDAINASKVLVQVAIDGGTWLPWQVWEGVHWCPRSECEFSKHKSEQATSGGGR